MLPKLRTQANAISLESMAPAQFLSAVTKRLPAFVDSVTNYLKGLFNFDKKLVPFAGTTAVNTEVRKTNYTTLMDLSIPIPVGLKVTYPEYLKVLEECNQAAIALLIDVVEPFGVYIGTLLSDPDKLAMVRNEKSLNNIRFHDLDKLADKLSKCFDLNKGLSEVAFGDVFKNNAQYLTAVQDLEAMTEQLSKINVPQLMARINEINGMMISLSDRIENNPDVSVSGTTLKAIAEISYGVAKECEFFSTQTYHLLQVSECFDAIQKKLGAVLKP